LSSPLFSVSVLEVTHGFLEPTAIPHLFFLSFFLPFLKDFIYLFVRERETAQAVGTAGRGRRRLSAEQGAGCGA